MSTARDHKQAFTVEANDGDVHATKGGLLEAWHIAAPWTDERFFGSAAECKARVQQIIKRCDSWEEA